MKQYASWYANGPFRLRIAADKKGITGIWFANALHFEKGLSKDAEEAETPVILLAKKWLDIYFSGQCPDFALPLHVQGTPFQKQVWQLLSEIPYGSVTTYGALAAKIRPGMSAQAVGQAVGANPVSIVIPCHRVIGKDGRLTGYDGGMENKSALLRIEGIILQESRKDTVCKV